MIFWRTWSPWLLGLGLLSACHGDDAKTSPKTSADASAETNTTGQAGAMGTGGSTASDASFDDDGPQAGGNAGKGGTSPQKEAGPSGGPVDLPGVYNIRDTGGLTTSSGKTVRRSFLMRSGHLGNLDAQGCQKFKELEVKSVVDLRDAADAASTPDASCVTSSAAYLLADLPKILPPSATSYTQTLDAAEPKLAAIWGHLGKPNALPAVVHCVIGRDRASLITAMLLLSLGVPEEQVIQDFVHNQDASVSVEAPWLQPMLDRVKAAGGIDAYLLSHGITQGMLDQLRSSALE